MKFEFVIAEELAVKEVKELVENYTYREQTEAEILEGYPHVVLAVRKGGLVLTDNQPALTLTEPIKKESGEVVVDVIKFRTRVTLSDKQKLSAGLDLAKDKFAFTVRVIGFIVSQPTAIIDKLHPFDNKVIEQLSTLFL
jgi:hypothetical protein